MATDSLTVAVPRDLLRQIRARAKQAKRTVEAEVVDLLNAAVSGEDRLPSDIEAAVTSVSSLDDRALRKAVKPIISPKQARRLAELNYKAQGEGLTAPEKTERNELLHVADKSMVVRAAVLAELHRRGVDVSEFTSP